VVRTCSSKQRLPPWTVEYLPALASKQAYRLRPVTARQAIDEATAREWIANGHVVQGWRALIARRGNGIVPELIAALPESFDGLHVIPALEVLPLLKDPPDDLADALWSRARGVLQPRAAEFLIHALAPIRGRGVPSLVAQFARNPFFMTPYHFVRFLAALGKWQSDTGLSFRVREGSTEVDFIEWIVWRRAASDRTDALYKSRLRTVQNIVPRALLARFEDDPALCAELIVLCGKAGPYHKALVEYFLTNTALASSIPSVFGETLDTFPEEVILRLLDLPGDFRQLVATLAKAPSASHPKVHEVIVRRVLGADFEQWAYRDVARILRVHSRTALLRLLKDVCQPVSDKALWLIRETEVASGELLLTEACEWLN
jgi:hypothetical protein